jgi:hypothetical protein
MIGLWFVVGMLVGGIFGVAIMAVLSINRGREGER